MQFNHIHCSGRFSRSAASLEAATDAWRKQCSVLTVTEVDNDVRGRTLAESGWGYYRQTGGEHGRDECATSWDLDVWVCQWKTAYRLIGRWPTFEGGTRWAVYCNTVILQHKVSGHRVLFSTIHAPNKIGGGSGFNPQGYKGAERIADYKRMMTAWAAFINATAKTRKPDAIVISADFNINFRAQWVQRYLRTTFAKVGMSVSWKHFGSKGTYGHAVIDGQLYKGVTTAGSVVIADVGDSTDHTPFKTLYVINTKAGTPVVTPTKPGTTPTPVGNDDDPDGQTGSGIAWWNFDDFGDDTVYEIEQI